MDTYNYTNICTWMFLHLYEWLYIQRNLLIRTIIRILLPGFTDTYMSRCIIYFRDISGITFVLIQQIYE